MKPVMSITTRFAPSPTGYLHLGHAASAFEGWRRAREGGGRAAGNRFLLRIEDIDPGRCRPDYAEAIIEDLAWLGLDWDGPVRRQSAHHAEYRAALDRLAAMDLLYPCFCTRAEIAAAMGAPHGGSPVYSGTCRHRSKQDIAERIGAGAVFALRLNMEEAIRRAGLGAYHEEGEGWIAADPASFGDIVLARKEISASYHLCVVHDDALQGVTLVTRGDDLRPATSVHVLLQALLGLPTPCYAHHPLLTDETGTRLSKRNHAPSLREMRERGETPEAIRRLIAARASPCRQAGSSWDRSA